MKSLIFLQGSAMGGGFALDTDLIQWMGIKAVLLIVGCVILYYSMKSLWPRDKW